MVRQKRSTKTLSRHAPLLWGKVTLLRLQFQWVKRAKGGKNATIPNLCANDLEAICERHRPKALAAPAGRSHSVGHDRTRQRSLPPGRRRAAPRSARRWTPVFLRLESGLRTASRCQSPRVASERMHSIIQLRCRFGCDDEVAEIGR